MFCHSKGLKKTTQQEIIEIIFLIIMYQTDFAYFNPIQDGLSRGCSRMWGGRAKMPRPKICQTYPTMMKLDSYTLPKEDPKNI